MKVLVTAGPTREFLDPVRFLSNRSTGRMGFAVAECARCRGHETVLISGPVSLDFPEGVRAVRVVSALDMLEAVRSELSCGCDAVVMTAAVADWRPEVRAERKLKKEESPPVLKMVRNPDILVETAGLRRGCVCVGFAAETDHVMESAVRKLEKKELDMIVANDVTGRGAGF